MSIKYQWEDKFYWIQPVFDIDKRYRWWSTIQERTKKRQLVLLKFKKRKKKFFFSVTNIPDIIEANWFRDNRCMLIEIKIIMKTKTIDRFPFQKWISSNQIWNSSFSKRSNKIKQSIGMERRTKPCFFSSYYKNLVGFLHFLTCWCSYLNWLTWRRFFSYEDNLLLRIEMIYSINNDKNNLMFLSTQVD